MQVGRGMEVASINTLHTPGAVAGTGRETDLAIEGSGFFIVDDGLQQYYTRDGTFTRGATGALVNANGFKLLGWNAEEGIEKDEEDEEEVISGGGVQFSRFLGEIRIPLGEEMLASATENISFSGNLDAAASIGDDEGSSDVCKYDTHVYDSLGNRHALTFTFTKAGQNEWEYEISTTDDGLEVSDGSGTICFTAEGRYVGAGTENDTGSEIHSFTLDLETETGAKTLVITPDFSALTQLAFPSSVSLKEQDGFPPGELTTFNIEASGMITGTYSNGMTRTLAQLALASFANPEGLLKKGANLYELSFNSGQPQLGEPGREGRGLIRSRFLEMSNVDLALEFTEMITASRGFQANTRVITTSDEVLMELINLKR